MKKVLGIGAAVLCSLVVLFTGCSYASSPSAPAIVVDKIEITNEPNKKEYFVGAAQLDLIGLKVTATYEDSNNSPVKNEDLEITGFDSTAAVESRQLQ